MAARAVALNRSSASPTAKSCPIRCVSVSDARTRAELETRQGWTVNAARLAVAAPWVVLAMLCTRPDSVQAYSRPAGIAVLAIGGVLSVVAYRVMVHIGRLPEESRVLR